MLLNVLKEAFPHCILRKILVENDKIKREQM